MIKKKSKNHSLLYLTNSSLSLQTDKKVILTISFPKELVVDKKVLDQDALSAFIAQKLTKISDIKSVKVLVIGKGLLFQTTVPLESPEEKEKEFYASIPFDEKDRAEKRVRTATKEYILVTSKKFYQTILDVLKKQSVEISSVVPLSLFVDEVDEDVLKNADVKSIFAKDQLYSQANFFDSVESSSDEEKETVIDVQEDAEQERPTEKSSVSDLPYSLVKKWNITALLVILGFLVISTIVFGIFLLAEQRRFGGSSTPTPSASVSVTPEPTKVPQEVDKGSLTVSVLNGTGTPGQAGKVKTIMEDLGYNSVDTGNADTTDNTKTTVSFTKKVSVVQSDEIVKELEKTFSSVTRVIDDTLSSDIVIVTGDEK